MPTRTWLGSTGLWLDPSQWSGATVPQPGDAAIVNAGTVALANTTSLVAGRLDNVDISLGNATFQATDAWFGASFSLSAQPGTAELESTGFVDFAGGLTVANDGAQFTIDATRSDGSIAPDFMLDSGKIQVSNHDDLIVNGTMDVIGRGHVSVINSGTLTNNGVIRIYSGTVSIGTTNTSDAVLDGTGTFDIGLGGKLDLEQLTTATPNVEFIDAGTLIIANTGTVVPVITGAQAGDVISLPNDIVMDKTYVPGTQTLVLQEARRQIDIPISIPSGTLTDGDFELIPQFDTTGAQTGTSIEIVSGTTAAPDSSPDPRTAAADRAEHADIVRQTTTLTGAGVKVGIISTSFDTADMAVGGLYQPGSAFIADASTAPAIASSFQSGTAKWYLPATVNVLSDVTGQDDEGRAMAELVHQIAPGATLYFASSHMPGGKAAAVQQLAAQGVNIIADDISNQEASDFYSTNDAIAQAVATAVAQGINYFVSAGNYQSAYYESNFTGVMQDVTITVLPATTATLVMQWVAPADSSDPGLQMSATGLADGTIFNSHAFDITNGAIGASVSIDNTGTTAARYDIQIDRAIGSNFTGTFRFLMTGASDASGTEAGGAIDSPLAGIGSGALNGEKLLSDVNDVGAAFYSNSPSFGLPEVPENFSSPGPGMVYLDANGNLLATPVSSNQPQFLAVDGVHTDVGPPFGDPFFGTSAAAPDAAAVAALMLQADPALTTAQITQGLAQSAVSIGLPGTLQGAGLIQAPAAVQFALDQAALCFAAGAAIRTPTGDVLVEQLAIGDRVVTAQYGEQPVIWIGERRLDLARHPAPERVRPIRVRANAFGPGVPYRDLLLSPDHAVFIDRVLVPIRYLVNGTTIRPETLRRIIHYFHVEIPRHAVLYANGLPAESLLDTGERSFFGNTDVVALFPHAPARDAGLLWEARGCAPLVVAGPALEAIRRRFFVPSHHDQASTAKPV